MGSRAKAGRGRVLSSRGRCAVVKSQHALIQVDLDPTYNPHLLLQQGGTEHYEFQECSRNFGLDVDVRGPSRCWLRPEVQCVGGHLKVSEDKVRFIIKWPNSEHLVAVIASLLSDGNRQERKYVEKTHPLPQSADP